MRETLSDRELEVARLVHSGLTNPQIANQLVLSVHTVRCHVRNALGKMGFKNRVQLSLWFERATEFR